MYQGFGLGIAGELWSLALTGRLGSPDTVCQPLWQTGFEGRSSTRLPSRVRIETLPGWLFGLLAG